MQSKTFFMRRSALSPAEQLMARKFVSKFQARTYDWKKSVASLPPIEKLLAHEFEEEEEDFQGVSRESILAAVKRMTIYNSRKSSAISDAKRMT